MSRQTEVVIAFPRAAVPPAHAIGLIFDIAGTEAAWIVSRSVGESREFVRLLASLEGEEDDVEDVLLPGRHFDREAVASAFRQGTSLSFFLETGPLVEALVRSVGAEIDPDNRGDFGLGGLTARIGDHDIFTSEDDEPVLLGRSPLSVTFYANGLPGDPDEFLAAFATLEPMRTFLDRADETFGPHEFHIILSY